MLGALSQNALKNLGANKPFIGTLTIHGNYGLSADDATEVHGDRTTMAQVREIIVLADTRFGKIATVRERR